MIARDKGVLPNWKIYKPTLLKKIFYIHLRCNALFSFNFDTFGFKNTKNNTICKQTYVTVEKFYFKEATVVKNKLKHRKVWSHLRVKKIPVFGEITIIHIFHYIYDMFSSSVLEKHYSA